MSNYKTEKRESIATLIDSSDFKLTDDILGGQYEINRKDLDPSTLKKLKKIFLNQTKKLIEGKRIRVWTQDAFINHYCYYGGFCPITGLKIPAEYLSCYR